MKLGVQGIQTGTLQEVIVAMLLLTAQALGIIRIHAIESTVLHGAGDGASKAISTCVTDAGLLDDT